MSRATATKPPPAGDVRDLLATVSARAYLAAMTSPTKLQRWLDIIAYLAARRLPISADELLRNVPAYAARWASGDARQQESARRGFERDKDELRRFGIPIRTVRYSMDEPEALDGYVMERRDFYLPYLRLVTELGGKRPYPERDRPASMELTRDEAPLALEALRRMSAVPGFPLAREARSAFRKLAFDIDPARFATGETVLFMDPPGTAALADRMRVLSGALLARKRVRFRYHGIHRGSTTDRDVAPWGLLFRNGHWYLVGHDATRDAVRVFRVGRMDDVTPNERAPRTPDYEIPADFTLDALSERHAWELGEGDDDAIVVRVLFRFPLSLWAERNDFGVHAEQLDDGAAVRTFDVQQVDPFVRWLLSLEGEAVVLEPDAVAAQFAAMAQRVADAHGEADHAG